jgi:uroporphyrinogen-III synthase
MNLRLPLHDCTILVTRPGDEAGATTAALAEAGARIIECPAIEFTSLLEQNIGQIRHVLEALSERRGWLVLPSPTAVRYFGEVLSRLHLEPADLTGLRLATIGPGSATILSELGLAVDFQPPLARRGLLAQTLPLYAPRPCRPGLRRLRDALADRAAGSQPAVVWLLLVTSPSAVDAIGDALADSPELLAEVGWLAIGPSTLRRARARGVAERLAAQAPRPRPQAIARAAAELAANLRHGGRRR